MEIGALTSRGRFHRRHHPASFITVVRHTGAGQFTGVRLSIGVRDLIGVHVGEVAVIGEVLVGEFVPDGAVRVGEVGLAGADEVGECTAAGIPFRSVDCLPRTERPNSFRKGKASTCKWPRLFSVT